MSGMFRYPNLYLAGAPKCGTTSLAYWLGQHPDIFAPIIKEPLIFADDLTSTHRRDPAEKATEHFGAWRSERYGLDATTHYFFSHNAPKQIVSACDEPHVYILVRNPADAVHSMFHQLRFNGAETLETLEQSLDAEPRRATALEPIRFGFPESYLYSRVYAYSKNIQRFTQCVGKSRLRVILFDDLIANPAEVTRSIFRDLGLDLTIADTLEFGARNSAKRVRSRGIHTLAVYPPAWAGLLTRPFFSRSVRLKVREWLRAKNTIPSRNPPLEPATRRRLNEQFRHEVDWLSDHLGRDLSYWLDED